MLCTFDELLSFCGRSLFQKTPSMDSLGAIVVNLSEATK